LISGEWCIEMAVEVGIGKNSKVVTFSDDYNKIGLKLRVKSVRNINKPGSTG